MKLPTSCLVAFGVTLLYQVNCLTIINEMDGKLILSSLEDRSTAFTFTLAGVEKLSGQLGYGMNLELPTSCEGEERCKIQLGDITVTLSAANSGFNILWTTANKETVFRDCFDLNIGEVNWYGGPQQWQQDWPIEVSRFVDRPYISMKTDNGAIAERYWLNSIGGYVFIEDKVPLFLDQNNLKNNSVCFIAKLEDPYLGRAEIVFDYQISAKDNVQKAHLHGKNVELGGVWNYPREGLIRNPIWTTWAKYKKDINDEVVLSFAQDIADHGFTGQIEIDEIWETCFGSLTFSDETFGNINGTVRAVKDLGFTVSLWAHPFVNLDCPEPLQYGLNQDLFVKSVNGNLETSWWEGTAHFIDFTNPNAISWFVDRLKLLQESYGIDTFKFDSGESDYTPPAPVFTNGNVELTPGLITSAYIDACATFGNAIEVRSAWRNQHNPVFIRMIDKDSRWSGNNGLASLIPTLFQINLSGYSFVLPDVIGGNGYGGEVPSAELLVRWTQATTFMPAMKFGYLPWDTPSDDFDVSAIIKKFVDLHAEYTNVIIAAMNKTISLGAPVNPPLWWLDPTNKDTFAVNDQYLLGEYILVAPIIKQGATSRDIVVPAGTWRDGNDDTIYEGPQKIIGYQAPIDVLPYFVKLID